VSADSQSDATLSPPAGSFDEIRSDLVEIVQSIVYATMHLAARQCARRCS